MKREELDHIVGAAANITGEDEFVIVGSQAILGSYPQPPEVLLQSMEADIYPARAPEKSIEIDGQLGDGSMFHRTFGYYAHGVGPETAKAPAGWEGRLVRSAIPPRVVSARRPVAYFLEAYDLVLSKCVAGRPRDWDYARAAIAAGLVEVPELLARIPELPVAKPYQDQFRTMLAGMSLSDTPLTRDD
jgi:hypothetical protein